MFPVWFLVWISLYNCWQCAVQRNLVFFHVRSLRGLVIAAYAFSVLYMKRALNWRKHLNSLSFWDGPVSLRALIFSGSADKPDLEKMVPTQDSEVAPKVHFFHIKMRPFSSRRVRQASRFVSCSSGVRPYTKMLSCMKVHPIWARQLGQP